MSALNAGCITIIYMPSIFQCMELSDTLKKLKNNEISLEIGRAHV